MFSNIRQLLKFNLSSTNAFDTCILESEILSSDKWLKSRILFPCHMSIEKMERTPANIVDDEILSDKKKKCVLYPFILILPLRRP